MVINELDDAKLARLSAEDKYHGEYSYNNSMATE